MIRHELVAFGLTERYVGWLGTLVVAYGAMVGVRRPGGHPGGAATRRTFVHLAATRDRLW